MKNGIELQEFVNQTEAAALLGMSGGGNIPKLLEKYEVLPVGKRGKSALYNKASVIKVRALMLMTEPKSEVNNGGTQAQRIHQLEMVIDDLRGEIMKLGGRVYDLEQFRAQLDG